MRRHAILWLAAILVSSSAAAAGPAYSGLVIFADSLSDPGNKFFVTGLANTPPYDLLDELLRPEGPCTRGGLHHSNGKTRVEILAGQIGIARDAR